MKFLWALPLILAGCQSLPLSQAGGGVKTLFVYPQPSCIIICTASISAIREDVTSAGATALTTGAKTSTQTASTTRSKP